MFESEGLAIRQTDRQIYVNHWELLKVCEYRW